MNTAESSTNDLECRLKLFVASRKLDDELFTIPPITTELIIKVPTTLLLALITYRLMPLNKQFQLLLVTLRL